MKLYFKTATAAVVLVLAAACSSSSVVAYAPRASLDPEEATAVIRRAFESQAPRINFGQVAVTMERVSAINYKGNWSVETGLIGSGQRPHIVYFDTVAKTELISRGSQWLVVSQGPDQRTLWDFRFPTRDSAEQFIDAVETLKRASRDGEQ